MISKLITKNFTVLKNADLKFSKELNVIIGENGSGKTHIMKLLYSVLSTLAEEGRDCLPRQPIQARMAQKLVNVFRPDQLGRLTTRKQGREKAEVTVEFSNGGLDCCFTFSTNSKTEVQLLKCPEKGLDGAPVYFPAKELLTLYPNFISMYKQFYTQYDETYFDTMNLLNRPYLKGPHEKKANELIHPLEEAIGGHIFLNKNGTAFYMQLAGENGEKGTMEVNLIAEGWRKFGMLTQVVLNGGLKDKGYLFWDEPEANLNPRLISSMASVIWQLSQQKKVQVFISTHSLFLLRELEYLSHLNKQPNSIRYFSLNNDEISQSSSSTELTNIASFEAETEQEDRILALRRGGNDEGCR